MEKLYEKPIGDDKVCYGFREPSIREIMNKINEIIDYINNLESKGEQSENE